MLIVNPGALPALPVAAELAKLLPERAPTLHSWLLAGAARPAAFDVRAHGCTAFESWQLTRAGYTPEPGLLQGGRPGAASGCREAPAGDAVWLAELVHLALGADQANLLDPGQMDLLPEETAALLDTARPLFEGTGFAVDALSPQRWRLRLPDGLRPQTASPQVVAGQRLNEWWRQDTETRPWRRLLNEIQMAWHEHPVNDARAARGLPPVNALWLYGGGTPWPIAPAGPERVLTGLDAPQRTSDWSAWLDALAELDAQHLRPLAGKKGVPDTATELLLLGDDRTVALTLKPRGGLLGLLPAAQEKLERLVVTPRLTIRPADLDACHVLQASGIHPLLARLWAARGVTHPDQTKLAWPSLLPPAGLTHSAHAAGVLADALQAGKKMLIVADYDCDGATACAVGLRALSAMGADVDFLVPNRFETGYGLSPAVVDLAVRHRSGKPDIIITVDNGIASVDGVAAANAAGIGVVITDHHLPGDTLPDALAIVNPNQPGCGFPSKNLAGVGVIFYMMLALRAELRRRGVYAADGGPRLDTLSDLVALGTVADVVKLDANNRLLVTQGLQRMRSGRLQPGLRALFAVAGREPRSANGFDLGFALGPRINAAGRLADMSLGIACLTTDDEAQALEMARELDNINRERRTIEAEMREQALAAMEEPNAAAGATVCVFDPGWHQGVVGLVASRLKEKFWRPTLAFAPAGDDEIRGSGRSIPDVHLRDALDLVSKRHPNLIRKFGGHAMAAGLTLGREDFPAFAPAFDAAVRELTGRDTFEPVIETDGSLESGYANADVAGMLQQQVWGAGFAAPLFLDEFTVRNQRLVGEKHLKLSLERGHQRFDAIWFGHDQSLPEHIQAAYRLEQNVWNGMVSVQLVIEHAA